jgi:NOL1/NOP2/fmu family ribosome biogenesis protein
MAISPEEARRQVRLGLDEPALPAYLHGESLKIPGDSGWVLAAIEVDRLKKAFPLGWGKRTGDVLKNNYPHGLRWK